RHAHAKEQVRVIDLAILAEHTFVEVDGHGVLLQTRRWCRGIYDTSMAADCPPAETGVKPAVVPGPSPTTRSETPMRRVWVPQLVVSLLLLGALVRTNPYGYYVLLRWVCCGVFAYLAVLAHAQRQDGWTWLLAVTALLYNPVLRVHLDREVWTVLNLITIGIAAAAPPRGSHRGVARPGPQHRCRPPSRCNPGAAGQGAARRLSNPGHQHGREWICKNRAPRRAGRRHARTRS